MANQAIALVSVALQRESSFLFSFLADEIKGMKVIASTLHRTGTSCAHPYTLTESDPSSVDAVDR